MERSKGSVKKKLIRLSKQNEKHLKQLAETYGASETLVINLFLEKSRDSRSKKENIYQYIERKLKGEE